MRSFAIVAVLIAVLTFAAQQPKPAPPAGAEAGGVAEIYFWKAKPGKLEEYNRYIRDYAQPIDAEAQRQGAFLSVTTYVAQRPDAAWTHMRVFLLRDREQSAGLQRALDAAKLRLHPDEQERNRQAAYAETLRELVAHETADILR